MPSDYNHFIGELGSCDVSYDVARFDLAREFRLQR